MFSTHRLRCWDTQWSRPALAAALLAGLLAGTDRGAAAGEIRVPQDRMTIQAGVDAAKSGDTVLVSAGVYQERIRLKVGITVKSAGDEAQGKLGLQRAEATIIDGSAGGAEGPGVVSADMTTPSGRNITPPRARTNRMNTSASLARRASP